MFRVTDPAHFVTALNLLSFDAVAWIEESWGLLTVATVDAIAAHVAAGGSAWFTYWMLFDDTGIGVPEARAAFGIDAVASGDGVPPSPFL